ncbi:hypothetical protein BB559_005210 [Furculomyces boomerangus]|uniref:Uncharacterized protein n=2 Tax=Harpellales TaxID=61421 RepID=A0A2T9Y893_9FUNG|nr:hypothetical protein BB559_005529 [Furculomyces boomerangus]PVU89180.1 hypothetical protein BB559_005210 [Furculomyces boomerangus]PWA01648.1 hypothetical protein BB558_002246 [Smittium angustum]
MFKKTLKFFLSALLITSSVAIDIGVDSLINFKEMAFVIEKINNECEANRCSLGFNLTRSENNLFVILETDKCYEKKQTLNTMYYILYQFSQNNELNYNDTETYCKHMKMFKSEQYPKIFDK